MEKNLKKAVVVVNRPGGGTTIAGNTVAKRQTGRLYAWLLSVFRE
jgi:tripartite-type tricarboxylate transporter receptor subunit TctC